jgi:translation elongation factor EF-G
VENVRVVLQDGASHPVDSNEMAFRIAAVQGFRQAYADASPQVLEPVMKVEVTVPTEFQGTIMGDLNRRKGMIMDSSTVGDDCVIQARKGGHLSSCQRAGTNIPACAALRQRQRGAAAAAATMQPTTYSRNATSLTLYVLLLLRQLRTRTQAEVPLNSMFGYSTVLRSNTQGKGEYAMAYSHHAPVSRDLEAELMAGFAKAGGPKAAG